jgi:hypothetical protein
MDVHEITPNRRPAEPVSGWGAAVRLGFVLSIVSALLAAAFAGRVATSLLICAVLAVCSVVGWASAERAPLAQPIRLRRR